MKSIAFLLIAIVVSTFAQHGLTSDLAPADNITVPPRPEHWLDSKHETTRIAEVQGMLWQQNVRVQFFMVPRRGRVELPLWQLSYHVYPFEIFGTRGDYLSFYNFD